VDRSEAELGSRQHPVVLAQPVGTVAAMPGLVRHLVATVGSHAHDQFLEGLGAIRSEHTHPVQASRQGVELGHVKRQEPIYLDGLVRPWHDEDGQHQHILVPTYPRRDTSTTRPYENRTAIKPRSL